MQDRCVLTYIHVLLARSVVPEQNVLHGKSLMRPADFQSNSEKPSDVLDFVVSRVPIGIS